MGKNDLIYALHEFLGAFLMRLSKEQTFDFRFPFPARQNHRGCRARRETRRLHLDFRAYVPAFLFISVHLHLRSAGPYFSFIPGRHRQI